MVFYEIKLSKLEIECLTNTKGFDEQMPILVNSSHYEKPTFTDVTEIVSDSEKIKNAYREYKSARDKNTMERSKLIQKYPEINEEGLTRNEECKKFFSQFSEEDKKRHEELFEQNHELNEKNSKLYFKEQNRRSRRNRSRIPCKYLSFLL